MRSADLVDEICRSCEWDIAEWLERLTASVADPHHIDADPDLAFHFDANPDPSFYYDSDPDPDPAFQLDADPDPTTHFSPDFDTPMLQNNDPGGGNPAFHFVTEAVADTLPAFHCDADVDPDPVSQNDADPDPQHCWLPKSRNSHWFNPSILRHSWIWGVLTKQCWI